ncbi:MAG: hypothetical protein A3F91_07165 [Flavobacteria bacterium RIFCSPLOWO2_12_FULL_35_11]|nr:MAG: hypothetical protein A3F91_07165 [Flavobacteria bacterium RIFCSPLOWO2_12_FULL_35_11]
MTPNLILLQIDATNFWIVNWYYIMAVLIGLISLTFAIKNYYKKNKEATSNNPINSIIQPKTSQKNIINIEVNSNSSSKTDKSDNGDLADLRTLKIDSIKHKVHILFIDDDTKFSVVKALKNSGWKKTSSVIDIKSIDIPIIKETDIFFVDINGVGKLLNCQYEGLDIALMLKQKYPNKKVIIYSANNTSYSFHKAWDICDYKLEKNAIFYQFQSLVEKYGLELYS